MSEVDKGVRTVLSVHIDLVTSSPSSSTIQFEIVTSLQLVRRRFQQAMLNGEVINID